MFTNRSKKFRAWMAISLFIFGGVLSAQSLQIQGAIIELHSQMPVADARIFIAAGADTTFARSNAKGTFSSQIEAPQSVDLTVQRFGYQQWQKTFFVDSDTSLRIFLKPAPIAGEHVTITEIKSRRDREMKTAFQPVTTFDASEFEKLGIDDPAAAISLSPGVLIKDYGGLGGLKTVSLRGLAATQTAVLIDGVRYDSHQSGVTDFSTLALNAFDAIEVFRGGNAAQFGADALAGAVNLRTATSEEAFLKMTLGHGAFATETAQLASGFSHSDFHFNAALAHRCSAGDYNFRFNAFGNTEITSRQNAGFWQNNAMLSARRNWEHAAWSTVLLNYVGERDIPGAVLQGVHDSQAHQSDRDTYIQSQLKLDIALNQQLTATGRVRFSQLNYTDPSVLIRPGGIDDEYETTDAFFRAAHQLTTSTFHFQNAIETGHARLSGNNLAQPNDESFDIVPQVNRTFFHAVSNVAFISEKPQNYTSAQLGLRFSHYSDAGHAVSPTLGVNWRPASHAPHFRAQVTHNFRVPSFAEQYYLNYGNRDIEPEKSWAFELGAHQQVEKWGFWLADFSLFALRVRDQIIAVPRSPVQWSTQNIGKTENHGFESFLEWQCPNQYFSAIFSYTLQQPTDQTAGSATKGKLLIYMPKEIVSTVFSAEVPIGRVLLQQQFSLRRVSYRYHMLQNDSESLMPGYFLWNVQTGVAFPISSVTAALRFKLENGGDRDYEIIKSYPMPLRRWQVELEVAL